MTTWAKVQFIGGHPALDLVNTAGGRTKSRDVERLLGYQDAADWGCAAGILDPAEQDQLAAAATADPSGAENALLDLRKQREALHTFLLAGIDGTDCEPSARERVQHDVVTAYRSATPSEGFRTGPAWVFSFEAVGMRLPARRIALAGAALLAGEQRAQISTCHRCSWMFLDASPTRRRRWCSMDICGNRAKAERHHRR